MRHVRIIVAILLSLAFTGAVWADENDFQLDRFSPCREGTVAGETCQARASFNPDDPNLDPVIAEQARVSLQRFDNFALALGQIFAPTFLSPAETLGEAGFAFGFETKFSVASSGDYWFALNSVDGTADNAESEKPPLFVIIQAHARKGLPFSFEIDASVAHLTNSEMVWLGGGVKWSLNEGFIYIPDLAVRGFGGVLTGAPDLNLVNAGFDVSLSKSFGLGGIFSLTPYAGYSLVFVIASSRVLDADPGFGLTPSGGYAPEFVFAQKTQNASRGFVGLRFVVDVFTLTVEGNFNGDVQNYGFNVGFDF